MSSQTTLVSKQVQLHQWARQIRDCNNRPKGMPVSEWCSQNGITKTCYMGFTFRLAFIMTEHYQT